MKVAIIGAGISGLACAIELERHKIKPVIFEKRAHIGEALDFCSIWPRVLNRQVMDPLQYLKKEFNLTLTPLNPIKKMIMYSPNAKATQRGSLGYVFKRGVHAYALENQLFNYVSSSVTFNKYIELEAVKDKFDYIIVATALTQIPKEIGVWTDTFNSNIRVALVVGKFKPTEVVMWQDVKYAKNGFCYLVPHNEKEASLVLIVNGITSYELDYYWKEFLFKEDIRYYISATIDAEHDCGFVEPRQVGNIFFVGNSGGFTDDLIGCGGINAIESGMLAAHAIVYGKDYNTLTEPIFKDIVKLHEIRKTMNAFGNSQLDLSTKALGFPLIKNLVYNNPVLKLSDAYKGAIMLRHLIKGKRQSVK